VQRGGMAIRAWRHGWRRIKGTRVWMFHGAVDSFKDRAVEHNFTTYADLEQCASVFRRLTPIGLAELAHAVRHGKSTPEDGALITFDDGYRNNIPACELLRKAGIRVAVFVCAGYPGGSTIWTAEVTLLVLHGGKEKIEILDREWLLDDENRRRAACRCIRGEMKRLPASQRLAVLNALREQFPRGRSEELLEQFESLRLMTWEEIRYLNSLGVEIGSHGMFHEIHNESQEKAVLEFEARRSKEEIERQVGVSCFAFAYPNGNVNGNSAAILREAGYELAFTTERGVLKPDQEPFRLPRVEGSRLHAAVRDAYYHA